MVATSADLLTGFFSLPDIMRRNFSVFTKDIGGSGLFLKSYSLTFGVIYSVPKDDVNEGDENIAAS